jgi:hypothetical protein
MYIRVKLHHLQTLRKILRKFLAMQFVPILATFFSKFNSHLSVSPTDQPHSISLELWFQIFNSFPGEPAESCGSGSWPAAIRPAAGGCSPHT